MTDKKLPWMKFNATEFMGDGSVGMMTATERGIYISLLCHAWTEGGVPDNRRRMAIIANATVAEVEDAWEEVLSDCFEPHPDRDGYLIQPRMERDRQEALEKHRKRVRAGRKGGRASATVRSAPNHLKERWSSLLQEVDGVCPRCREEVGVGVDGGLVIDHIVPRSEGGEDEPENIQPLCRSCNAAKGPETIDWMERWRQGKPGRKGGGSSASTVDASGASSNGSTDGPARAPSPGNHASGNLSSPTVGSTSEEGEEREKGEDVASWMHDVWHDALGRGRRIKLTRKRKQKYEAMYEEHLSGADDPRKAWRAVLFAVTQSDHHMSKRSYQMPESLLRNEERRDTWIERTAETLRNGGASDADRKAQRRRQKLARELEQRRSA